MAKWGKIIRPFGLDNVPQDLHAIERARPPSRLPKHGWALVAVGILAVGTVGAFLSARAVAANQAAKSRAALRASAYEVSSSLNAAIEREQDLVVNAAAFVSDHPALIQSQFEGWVRSVQAFRRYPELLELGFTPLTRAAGLRALLTRLAAQPYGPLPPTGRLRVLPSGNRSFYCITEIGAYRPGFEVEPLGYDFCAKDPRLPSLVRDTGSSVDIVYDGVLSVSSPVYRGGVVPSTVAGRRQAFMGLLGDGLNAREVLTDALRGRPGLAVAWRYRSGTSRGGFTYGRTRPDERSVTIALRNSWTVQTFGMIPAAGAFASGSSRAVLIAISLLSALISVLIFVLATQRRRAMRLVAQKTSELSFLALHDRLTLLPNRALVIDRAERMLARTKRAGTPMAALFVDLDGFKTVNDTLGHAAGDKLLQVVASRLLSVARDADTVGRLGGDEFVVLLESEHHDARFDLVAERVIAILREPIVIDDSTQTTAAVSASVGIALGSRASAEELLGDADLALYCAKQSGKDRFAFFEPSMHMSATDRSILKRDLEGALQGGQLFLLYQPKFDLHTEVITGVEALLRWRHPSRGIITPDVFMPIAEESAVIMPIGRWVLRTACTQAAEWSRRGYCIAMSVNVSGRHLENDQFIADVNTTLTDSDVDPRTLTLEITDTIMMRDTGNAVRRLTALKALGVRVAINDVGGGRSLLGKLLGFPLDAMKIDRSLIAEVSTSKESAALLHLLVEFGKTLGTEIVGVGIGDRTQLELLRKEGCDYGQGFLVAGPLPAQGVEQLLEQAVAT
jgi:diguanylate cyclase (GGDEF)-like protein